MGRAQIETGSSNGKGRESEEANEVQAKLSGLPLLPGEELRQIAAGINVPVEVREIDLSNVLDGPTMSFLLAGSSETEGTPAFELKRAMASFLAENPEPIFTAYREACEHAWRSAGLADPDIERMGELLTKEAAERGVKARTTVTAGSGAAMSTAPSPEARSSPEHAPSDGARRALGRGRRGGATDPAIDWMGTPVDFNR